MNDFKETCIWMSYRYAIGRSSIASVTHAKDIANHMDWVSKDRWTFISRDIMKEINDSIQHTNNIVYQNKFDGYEEIDAYSILFEHLSNYPYYAIPENFIKYTWHIDFKLRKVTIVEKRNTLAVSNLLNEYSYYKDWIKLAIAFRNKTVKVKVQENNEIKELECFEWWDYTNCSDGTKLTKKYSLKSNFMQNWYISPEFIKEVSE